MLTLPRIILFALIVLLAAGMQFRMQEAFGVTFEFALSALIAISFWASGAEYLALTAFAFFLMNWSPKIDPDLIVFAALALAASGLRALVPSRREITTGVLTALAVALFYMIQSRGVAIITSPLLWKDILGSALMSVLVFIFLRSLYEPKAKGQLPFYGVPN